MDVSNWWVFHDFIRLVLSDFFIVGIVLYHILYDTCVLFCIHNYNCTFFINVFYKKYVGPILDRSFVVWWHWTLFGVFPVCQMGNSDCNYRIHQGLHVCVLELLNRYFNSYLWFSSLKTYSDRIFLKHLLQYFEISSFISATFIYWFVDVNFSPLHRMCICVGVTYFCETFLIIVDHPVPMQLWFLSK